LSKVVAADTLLGKGVGG